MNGEKVTFPNLSNAEIVDCLRDLGVQQLTESNLVKPEPDFVHILYENVVQKLIGCTGEDMVKYAYEAYSSLEYPQIYENAIYEINFMRNLFRVMHTVGVDFKLSDLLAPTYARTRNFLNGIINFAKYREEKFLKFQELDRESFLLTDDFLLAEERNLEVQEQLRALKTEIAGEESVAQELHKKKTDTQNKLYAFNQLQSSLREEISQLKKSTEEISIKADGLIAKRTELEREKAHIQSRILKNPESVIKGIEEIRGHLEKERKALAESESRRNEYATQLFSVEKNRKALEKCTSLVVEINQELSRVESEKKEIKGYKDNIKSQENVFRELDVNQEKVTRQLSMTQKKVLDLQLEQDSSKESRKSEIDAERSKKIDAEKERASLIEKLKKLDLEIAELTAEEENMTRIHQEEMNTLNSGMCNLMKQFQAYHAQLSECMKKIEDNQLQYASQRQQQNTSFTMHP